MAAGVLETEWGNERLSPGHDEAADSGVSLRKTVQIPPAKIVLITSVSRGILGGVIQYISAIEHGLSGSGVPFESITYPRVLNLMEGRKLPRLLRIPLHLFFVGYCLLRVLQARDRYSRVVVHTHGASWALLVGVLARAFGAPAVHTFHSLIQRRSYALKALSPRVDALVFVSKALRDSLEEQSRVRNERMLIIPACVDTAAYAPVDIRRRRDLRKVISDAFGLPDRGHLVTFVGRIVPEKGIDELLDAASLVRKAGVPVSFLLVGPILDSPGHRAYAQALQGRIRALGLEDSLRLVGPIEPPLKIQVLLASDALVCPSRAEAFGITATEAMSCGVPVIGFRVGGLQEQVHSGVNGILAEPGDVAQLAQSIRTLIDSTNLRTEMGVRARRYVLDEHSQGVFIRRYLDLYRSTLDGAVA